MPITTLDSNAALVVIDLQKGILGFPTVHPISEIIDRTARLARAFRERGHPVILVNVTGMAPGRTDAGRPHFEFPPDWTDLVPELGQHPEDHVVSKQRWGAFIGTDLNDYLQELGVTQIVLTGVATSIGVESTARSAHDYGYNVALVVDAMSDRSAEAHQYCLETIFPRLGEADTTENVLGLLG